MRRRFLRAGSSVDIDDADDPLSGVANLFDVAIVFAVGLMFALVSAYHLIDLMSPETEVTITKESSDGSLEIITKKGKEVKIEKVTKESLSGEGKRLGVAYKLKDGKVIYVPENKGEQQK